MIKGGPDLVGAKGKRSPVAAVAVPGAWDSPVVFRASW